MAADGNNLGMDGGMPPLAGGPSLSEQEAAMRKGKGAMLAGMIIAVVVIAVGLFFLLSGTDEKFAYSDIGKQVNAIKLKQFDAFWGCAFKGVDLRDIKSSEDLAEQIDDRASQARSVYVKQLRDNCFSKLEQMQSKFDVMIAPEGVEKDVKTMREATSKLRSAWSDYASYVDNLKTDYDDEIARPKIIEIARAWYDFKKAHASFNQTVKKKIE
jgi:hypothetical protein